jgi:glutamate/tyrosine decarboxylase-like PLP-dependent enzyme
MESLRCDDAPWHSGRSFKPAYFAGDDVLDVAHEAFGMYIDENALYSRTSYPSLHRYEVEVVDMLLDLLHAPDRAGGSTTSGGTETNVMAVKTARDWAREHKPVATAPEMIVPRTAHPSFDKAAHLLGVRVVRMAESPNFGADVEAMASAVNENSVMLVASAPPYPYGECDPVARIAALARQHNLWMHVDACLGGMILPFARDIDASVPEFDFAIPGVTSISVDLHKYGYAAKGVSALLLRDAALERFQRTTFEDWPAGVYSTPNISGSRSGGAIASAWAVMRYLGRDGYREVVGRLMQVRQALVDGIESIEGLSVYAKPHSFQFAFGSDAFDIFAVAEGLGQQGWLVGRALEPPSIMLMFNLSHEPVVATFLSELREVVDEVKATKVTAGTEPAIYAI